MPPPRARPSRLPPGLPALAVLLALAGLAFVALVAGARARAENLALLALLDDAGSPDAQRRSRARDALLRAPASPAPRLAAVVSRGVTRWYAQILPWFDGVPWLAELRERQGRRERAALEILQRLGPSSAPALVPLLAERRFGGRDAAVALLRAYGTNALPDVLAALRHPDPETRAGAVVALGKFSSHDLGGLAPLRAARRDAAVPVRLAAIWALAQMRDRPDEVVADLAAALDDPSDRVRLEAMRALRPFAARGEPAVEPLRRCLLDASREVRGEAALALAQLGRIGEPARDDLLRVLRARRPGFREAAAALVQVSDPASPENEEGLRRLREGLGSGDLGTRLRTLELLAVLGARATSAVPGILPLLENPEPGDDRSAVSALRRIQPEAVPERFRQGRPGR